MKRQTTSIEWISPNDTSICVFGRQAEAATITKCIDRIRTHDAKGECLICHGLSGVGKTHLIHQVVASRSQPGDLIGFGKFGQTSRPYGGIIDAVSHICEAFVDNPNQFMIRKRIKHNLSPSDVHTLLKTIPHLRCMVDQEKLDCERPLDLSDGSNVELQEMTTDTASIRFRNVFRRLLLALASADHPVFLVLDDMQWADTASRDLLDSVLLDGSLRNLLVLGSVRDGESTRFDLPVHSKFAIQSILCSKLAVPAVVCILAKTLGLDQNEQNTIKLGEIVHKRCDGNFFYIKQYMHLLHRDGHVWWNDSNNRFDFDLNSVETATTIPMTVLELLKSNVKRLDHSVVVLLVLWSCSNHQISSEILVSLVSNEQLVREVQVLLLRGARVEKGPMLKFGKRRVQDMLEKVKAAGLVEQYDDKGYRFIHDHVQQAILALIPSHRSELSALLGLHLHQLSKIREERWLMFVAVTLLKRQRSETVPPSVLATVCLEAADVSYTQAGFESAAKLADHGIKVLSVFGWKQHYRLMVDLYSISAKAHFSCGSFLECRQRINELQQHSVDVEDCMTLFDIYVRSVTIEQDYATCIEHSLKFLKLLGVHIPRNPSLPRVLFRLARLRRKLRGPITEVIARLPPCRDPKISVALMILNPAIDGAYWRNEKNLILWVCITGIELTLAHGVSDYTPMALVAFAGLLGILGEVKEAYSLSKAALEMARTTGFDFPRVRDVHNVAFCHLKEPMNHIYESWMAGKMAAVNIGDSLSIGITAFQSTALGVVAGSPFRKQRFDLDEFWSLLSEFRQTAQRNLFAPYYQMVTKMMKLDDPNLGSLAGDFFDDEQVLALVAKKKRLDPQKNALVLSAHRARSILLYVTGAYETGEDLYRSHQRCITEEMLCESSKITHHVILALNHLACARKMGKKPVKSRVKHHLSEITKFDVLGSPNIPVFLAFLQAETLSLESNNVSQVVAQYNRAIQELERNAFFLLHAKAVERLGDYLLSKGDVTQAEQTISKAWDLYSEYGVNCMFFRLQDMYGDRLELDLSEPKPVVGITC